MFCPQKKSEGAPQCRAPLETTCFVRSKNPIVSFSRQNFEWCAALQGSLPPRTRARRLLSAALHQRWPQVCRVKITSTVPPTNRVVSTTTRFDDEMKNSMMKCLVKWIPLTIFSRLINTQARARLIFQSTQQVLCNRLYVCIFESMHMLLFIRVNSGFNGGIFF